MGRPPKTQLPANLADILRRIGNNITELREQLGITQAELARRAGLSNTTLNGIEKRKDRDIRLSTLADLARALSVDPMQLLKSSDLDLTTRDQAQLLKASEAILRVTRKLR